MTRNIQIVLGFVGVALVTLLLWPLFVLGSPVFPALLIMFVIAGAGLAYVSLNSDGRWSRWALLGVIPGFIAGGVGAAVVIGLVNVSRGAHPLGALAAPGLALLCAFAGALLGAASGGYVGRCTDENGRRTG